MDIASLGAIGCVITLALAEGEELVAHVSIVTILVKRSVDRAPEFSRAVEAVNRRWRRVLVVAVGTGDDDLKAVAPLTLVGGFGRGNGGAPECAFEVGSRRRVGAVLKGRLASAKNCRENEQRGIRTTALGSTLGSRSEYRLKA